MKTSLSDNSHLKKMSAVSCQSWTLDRYARFVCNANELGKCGEWKESHNLVRARSWMRGLSRNDSLLFMYKFKTETRRFRVRFSRKDDASGLEVCAKVIQQLSNLFPIKTCGGREAIDKADYVDKEKHSDMMQPETVLPNKEMKSSAHLYGEVTLGVMAQAILSCKALPLAYQQHQENLDMVPHLVHLCLGDPAFPAFVESVEGALKTIVDSQ